MLMVPYLVLAFWVLLFKADARNVRVFQYLFLEIMDRLLFQM
jgi:hypothetical protein